MPHGCCLTQYSCLQNEEASNPNGMCDAYIQGSAMATAMALEERFTESLATEHRVLMQFYRACSEVCCPRVPRPPRSGCSCGFSAVSAFIAVLRISIQGTDRLCCPSCRRQPLCKKPGPLWRPSLSGLTCGSCPATLKHSSRAAYQNGYSRTAVRASACLCMSRQAQPPRPTLAVRPLQCSSQLFKVTKAAVLPKVYCCWCSCVSCVG